MTAVLEVLVGYVKKRAVIDRPYIRLIAKRYSRMAIGDCLNAN
jgi:hypothetical protein